jgi:four helix bundle protein
MAKINSFRELRVYQHALDTAMEIFEIVKNFPPDEKFSLTDQIRRSSRGICANLGEAWHKRRYEKHFVSKITDVTMEASETRVWLDFALRCEYIGQTTFDDLDAQYAQIIAQLVTMESRPGDWTIK